jgi:hypothetical protein
MKLYLDSSRTVRGVPQSELRPNAAQRGSGNPEAKGRGPSAQAYIQDSGVRRKWRGDKGALHRGQPCQQDLRGRPVNIPNAICPTSKDRHMSCRLERGRQRCPSEKPDRHDGWLHVAAFVRHNMAAAIAQSFVMSFMVVCDRIGSYNRIGHKTVPQPRLRGQAEAGEAAAHVQYFCATIIEYCSIASCSSWGD